MTDAERQVWGRVYAATLRAIVELEQSGLSIEQSLAVARRHAEQEADHAIERMRKHGYGG